MQAILELTKRLSMAAERAMGFIANPEVQSRFLGPSSHLPPSKGATVFLYTGATLWRQGTVESAIPDGELVFRLQPALGWHPDTVR